MTSLEVELMETAIATNNQGITTLMTSLEVELMETFFTLAARRESGS